MRISPFSVVIPTRNVFNLRESASAVLMYERDLETRDVVVDDDETGAVHKYCRETGLSRIRGKKPFIFARNANRGLWEAFETSPNAILLNDDAVLKTKGGFTKMIRESTRKNYGIVSAVTNSVGNERQFPHGTESIRRELGTICFVCVLITHDAWTQIGSMDERYNLDYGVEDGDYCHRANLNNVRAGIYDGCFVDHASLKSTYRPDGLGRSFQQNKELFEKKWGVPYK